MAIFAALSLLVMLWYCARTQPQSNLVWLIGVGWVALAVLIRLALAN